jgi:pimeloyl-ACP methyl ester carboxylesterase
MTGQTTRKKLFLIAGFILMHGLNTAKSQIIDTLISVGNSRLHFHVIKGQNMPILFESGGGDSWKVWNKISTVIADSTKATIITYDRMGFGKSDIDTSEKGIVNEIKNLEIALGKLGYTGNIMLVAHSLGGFYSILYASRHPHKIKAAVMLDANLACFFTDEHIEKNQAGNDTEIQKFKEQKNWGMYRLMRDFTDNIYVMRKTTFPANIPVVDIVAEKTHFIDSTDIKDWDECHKRFVADAPNRKLIIAKGSGHYIYFDKPELTIKEIVKTYLENNK